MKSISTDHTVTIMSSENLPVKHIESGEIIKIETKDCFANRLQNEEQTLSSLPWDSINPCTGPIYVNGAQKGDILKVKVLDISVSSQGVVIKDKDDLAKYGLVEKEKSMQVPVCGNEIVISEHIRIPLKPMIGVMGTAPEIDTLATLPGEHGGNMDNKMIKSGSTVFLPVFHEGALLSIGDLHASMGDGEAAGCGIEIAGTVTVQIEIVQDDKFPVPMVISDDKIGMVASAPNLDEAAKKSSEMLLEYMIKNCKIDSDIAWKLLAATGNVHICQFANKIKTVRCEMPQQFLKPFC